MQTDNEQRGIVTYITTVPVILKLFYLLILQFIITLECKRKNFVTAYCQKYMELDLLHITKYMS